VSGKGTLRTPATNMPSLHERNNPGWATKSAEAIRALMAPRLDTLFLLDAMKLAAFLQLINADSGARAKAVPF